MSWVWSGSGKPTISTADTKAVLDDIRPSLTDGPSPSGATRGGCRSPERGRERRDQLQASEHAYAATLTTNRRRLRLQARPVEFPFSKFLLCSHTEGVHGDGRRSKAARKERPAYPVQRLRLYRHRLVANP